MSSFISKSLSSIIVDLKPNSSSVRLRPQEVSDLRSSRPKRQAFFATVYAVSDVIKLHKRAFGVMQS